MTGDGDRAGAALRDARPAVFWTDRDDLRAPRPALSGAVVTDLLVVGGGFTGLWAALQAAERTPGRRVVVLEAETVGFGASSRNGGFVDSSLTHGLENAVAQWPDEVPDLVRLGRENLTGLRADVDRLGIDCDLRACGDLALADAAWQAEEVAESVELHRSHGIPAELLDEQGVRDRIRSPRFVAGMYRPDDTDLVDPARLAAGLADACEAAGVVVHDRSPVTGIERDGAALVARTDAGRVKADRVVVATNAYRGPIGRNRRWVFPVYDHVLMTEPLSGAQLASLGWTGREAAEDAANRFHYFRLTADDRMLWGGYEPSYHWGNGVEPAFDQNDRVHALLADHFFATFPQLEDVRFSHRWGGPIATTSRFSAAWGTRYGGRLAWAAGYAGLGVGASRFGGATALDLVDGLDTERTDLEMVRKRPIPIPPEPLRSMVVAVTKRAVERADASEGRRGLWLRVLDRFDVGLDF